MGLVTPLTSPALQQMQTMGLAAVSSSNPPASQGDYNPVAHDWQILQGALARGDISGAQNAFAAIQRDLQKSEQPTVSVFQPFSGAAGQAFRVLRTSLQQGDLANSQSAFALLQGAFKATSLSPAASPNDAAASVAAGINASPSPTVENFDSEEEAPGAALNVVA